VAEWEVGSELGAEAGLQTDSSGIAGARRRSAAAALIVLALGLTVLSAGISGCASDGGAAEPAPTAAEDGSGRLEPRYQPREPLPEPFYNNSYLFGMTRGVTNSTIHPAAQMPLLILTIPLDIVFLPFAAIAGFF
jgi:hypothetical protein